jgi:DNA polymerase-3 subunit gamma/tau
LAHAFLFAGPRGVGKTSAARILAKAMNCADGPRTTPCNQCENCKEIAGGNAIDVLEIDGASNTGVDNIRELREHVKYLPSKSRYKIYIIDEVHMLSTSAFNALLKTLEEPPPHVFFIFATTEPHKIPLTILSRCQRFDFRRISLNVILGRLREIVDSEGVTVSDDALSLIAREAEGSLRDALSLLDQAISYGGQDVNVSDLVQLLGIADRKMLFDLSAAVIAADARMCLQLVEEAYRLGYDVEQFFRTFLEHFRNLMVAKVADTDTANINVPDQELEQLRAQAGEVSFDDLYRCFQILLRGIGLMARSSFPKIIVEMTLVEMAYLKSLVPLEEILAKVEELATGIPERWASLTDRANVPRDAWKEGPDGGGGTGDGGNTVSADRAIERATEHATKEWQTFLDFVRGENPVLAAFIGHGRPLVFDDSSVEIGFAKGSFAMERMNDTTTLDDFREALSRYFDREVPVNIRAVEGSNGDERMPDVGTVDRNPPDQEKRRDEVLDDPTVKQALEIFKGKVVDVKVNDSGVG